MISCPNCNKELNDDAKICDGCNTPLAETADCSDSDAQTAAEATSYENNSVSNEEIKTEPVAVPVESKKSHKKAVIFGAVGVAIVAAVILVFALFFGGDKEENNYALYVRDKELFYNSLEKKSESWQITSDLVEGDTDINNDDLADMNFKLSISSYMSKDGKYLFYLDEIEDDEIFNLYYKEIDKFDAKAFKIDSEIQCYIVNEAATVVTYLKGDEDELYQYNIKDDSKEKIASDVSNFMVSDDGSEICYLNDEDGLYIKLPDKDREKLASDVSRLSHIELNDSGKLETLYYIKDGSLYKQAIGEGKVKIASDVNSVLAVYSSGEIYYTKGKLKSATLSDYVIDDKKAEDEKIGYVSRPYSFMYDSHAEYLLAMLEYNEYVDKLRRDELREDLAEETLYQSVCSLCYYNGEKESVVTEKYVTGTFERALDASVVSYSTSDTSKVKKVKLSEIESVYEFKNTVEETLSESVVRFISVKDKATEIDQKDADVYINDAGTSIYYVADVSDGHGQLYHISVSGGALEKPEEYDSEVYNNACRFINDEEFAYFKDYDDYKGELYINKKSVDYDVKSGNMIFDDENGRVFYYTDWDDDKDCGMLKVYNGEESAKIAEDVSDYTIIPDGRVLYLANYSLEYYKGELYEWSAGEARKLDDDVVCVLHYYMI